MRDFIGGVLFTEWRVVLQCRQKSAQAAVQVNIVGLKKWGHWAAVICFAYTKLYLISPSQLLPILHLKSSWCALDRLQNAILLWLLFKDTHAYAAWHE